MNATRNANDQSPRILERQVDGRSGDLSLSSDDVSAETLARARFWMWGAVLGCLLIKIWLGYTRYFNQDEFESIHQGWLIYTGAVPYRDFNSNHPPLAFETLALLNHLTADSGRLLLLARTLTLTLSLLSIALVFQIGQSIYGRLAAYLAVIAYVLNSSFWEWSLEVRTDSFMVPLWLSAVALLFSSRPKSITIRMLLIGLFSGAAFWTNQKAIFHALPIGVLMLCGGPDRQLRFKHVAIAIVGSLIPTAYVVLRSSLNGAWDELWFHNFSGTWGLVSDSPYRDDRSVTINANWIRDTGFWVLAILAIVGGFRSPHGRGHRFVLLTCIWMSVTLFLTPGPFPYYMMSILPMFAVAIGGWGAMRLKHSTETTVSWKPWLVLPLVGLLLFPPLVRLLHLSRPTAGFQKTVVRIGQQLSSTHTSVFDGAGILLNRPDAYPFHWVLWISERERLAAGELPPLIETLRENECRLVVDNFRTKSLQPDLRAELEQQFVSVWGPLRVPGFDSVDAIGTEPQSFELWYDGVYQGNRDDILIDGLPLREPKFLAAGQHTIALASGRGRVQITDISRAQHIDLPADTSREIWGEYGFRY